MHLISPSILFVLLRQAHLKTLFLYFLPFCLVVGEAGHPVSGLCLWKVNDVGFFPLFRSIVVLTEG